MIVSNEDERPNIPSHLPADSNAPVMGASLSAPTGLHVDAEVQLNPRLADGVTDGFLQNRRPNVEGDAQKLYIQCDVKVEHVLSPSMPQLPSTRHPVSTSPNLSIADFTRDSTAPDPLHSALPTTGQPIPTSPPPENVDVDDKINDNLDVDDWMKELEQASIIHVSHQCCTPPQSTPCCNVHDGSLTKLSDEVNDQQNTDYNSSHHEGGIKMDEENPSYRNGSDMLERHEQDIKNQSNTRGEESTKKAQEARDHMKSVREEDCYHRPRSEDDGMPLPAALSEIDTAKGSHKYANASCLEQTDRNDNEIRSDEEENIESQLRDDAREGDGKVSLRQYLVEIPNAGNENHGGDQHMQERSESQDRNHIEAAEGTNRGIHAHDNGDGIHNDNHKEDEADENRKENDDREGRHGSTVGKYKRNVDNSHEEEHGGQDGKGSDINGEEFGNDNDETLHDEAMKPQKLDVDDSGSVDDEEDNGESEINHAECWNADSEGSDSPEADVQRKFRNRSDSEDTQTPEDDNSSSSSVDGREEEISGPDDGRNVTDRDVLTLQAEDHHLEVIPLTTSPENDGISDGKNVEKGEEECIGDNSSEIIDPEEDVSNGHSPSHGRVADYEAERQVHSEGVDDCIYADVPQQSLESTNAPKRQSSKLNAGLSKAMQTDHGDAYNEEVAGRPPKRRRTNLKPPVQRDPIITRLRSGSIAAISYSGFLNTASSRRSSNLTSPFPSLSRCPCCQTILTLKEASPKLGDFRGENDGRPANKSSGGRSRKRKTRPTSTIPDDELLKLVLKRHTSPTKPCNSYVFFLMANWHAVQFAHPHDSFEDISRRISNMWSGVSEKDKQRYKYMASQDRTRYKKQIRDV